MLFNEKTCFIVFNKRNYDDMFCNFRNYKETVQRTTCTNLSIWCQQTKKTTLKCNADSFGQSANFGSLRLNACVTVSHNIPFNSINREKWHELQQIDTNT